MYVLKLNISNDPADYPHFIILYVPEQREESFDLLHYARLHLSIIRTKKGFYPQNHS